jgi:hypothetical protein
MKIYINNKQYEDTDIKIMTREQFLLEEIPNTPVEMKAKIYDQLTLDEEVFQQNIKDGMYTIIKPKTQLEIMQETLDALVIASLEV